MKFFLTAWIAILPLAAFSLTPKDTTYWNNGGVTSLTFSQVSLKNWAAGGDNSTSFQGHIQLFADHVKGPVIFESNLEMGYGLINQGGQGFRKADDKINFNSKYGRRLSADSKKWYWTTNVNFRTQFADGFNQNDMTVKISDWFAPAYIFLSIGIDYKPTKNFWIAYTPVSAKITIVSDERLSEIGAFGVDPGDMTRTELGSYLTTVLKTNLLENIDFESKLQLFSNYRENPENVDVNWETTFVLKVNSFVTTKILNQLIYDDDIDIPTFNDVGEQIGSGPKLQFKNIFGVGLTYQFGKKRKKTKTSS